MLAVLNCRMNMWDCMYEGGLKSSFEDVISAVDYFLTNGIQTLQRWWKKCVDRKEK